MTVTLAGCSFDGESGASPDATPGSASDGGSADASSVDAAPVETVVSFVDAKANSTTGGNSSNFNVSSVALTLDGENDADSMLIVAVSTKPFTPYTGIELNTFGVEAAEFIEEQCGARGQSGVAVFAARGITGQTPMVSADLTPNVQTAVIAVARYSASNGAKVRFLSRNNRLDSGATCNGAGGPGVDDEGYAVTLVPVAGRHLLGAISLREHDHDTPMPQGWSEVVERNSGGSGGDSGIVLLQADAPENPYSVTGNFEGDGNAGGIPDVGNDWGAVFVQLY